MLALAYAHADQKSDGSQSPDKSAPADETSSSSSKAPAEIAKSEEETPVVRTKREARVGRRNFLKSSVFAASIGKK